MTELGIKTAAPFISPLTLSVLTSTKVDTRGPVLRRHLGFECCCQGIHR